jgi:plasmid maintenance system antidote protein VapI
MAVRLSIAFDTSAEIWMNQQAQYDLRKGRPGSTQRKGLKEAYLQQNESAEAAVFKGASL